MCTYVCLCVCLSLDLSSFCVVSAAVHFDFLSLCTEQFAQLQSSTATATKFPCDESGGTGSSGVQ